MIKVDPAVKKETFYIALWVVIFSALMHAVFCVLRLWSFPVLFGNLLGGGIAVLNFFLMGLSVQSAISKDEGGAKQVIRTSQIMRLFMLAIACIVGVLVPIFNTWSAIIPLFFPRIAIALRPLFLKRSAAPQESQGENEQDADGTRAQGAEENDAQP